MRIKEAIAEKQVTSAWLAEKIGISKVAMSNIVTGKNDPSVETLLKISEALGVSILYLLEMDNENPSENSIVCPKCGTRFVAETND